MRLTSRYVAGAALVAIVAALAAVFVLPGALASDKATFGRDIYRLTVTSHSVDGTEVQTNEWGGLHDGSWEADYPDGTFVGSATDYVTIDRETGTVSHRTGSSAFLGPLVDPPAGVLALRAYMLNDGTLAARGYRVQSSRDAHGKTTLNVTDTAGRPAFSVRIEDQVTDSDAAAQNILDTNPASPQVTDTEVAVGHRSQLPVQAYWFGRDVEGWHAVAAAEHSRVRTASQAVRGLNARADSTTHVTFYERPGIRQYSGMAGTQARVAGELQVASEPIGLAHAQAMIDALNGHNGDETYPPFPRSTVRLADGETVTVVPEQFDGAGAVRSGFFVITDATLVSVTGEVQLKDIPNLAASLTPLS